MNKGDVLDGPRMEETEYNPYQTPEAGLSSEAVAGEWLVDDRRLLFRHEAELPDIDLFTGRTDLPLLAVSQVFEVAVGGRSGWLYVAIMLLAVTAVAVRRELDLNLILAIFGLIVVSYLIGLILKRNVVSTVLNYKISEEAQRRPRWRPWAQMALAIVGISFFVGTVFTDSLVWMAWGLGVMCTALVLLVIVRFARGGLKCTGVSDGWFVMEGIPRASLQVLEQMQPRAAKEIADE